MEEIPLKIEVKIISRETIKPSIPTPPHLKSFKLSYVDQITTPTHTCVLLFYNPTSQTLDISTSLKTSLSKTLTHFYPLAGRVKQSTIICSDEGVPFTETRVNCSLLSLLKSPNKFELLPKLLPPRDSLGNLDSLVGNPNFLGNLEKTNNEGFLSSRDSLGNLDFLGNLEGNDNEDGVTYGSYQVNIFTCGGIVLGWYDIHKITDGSSATTFLKLWAAIAAQRDVQIEPNLVAAVEAFPPLDEVKGLLPLADATKDHAQSSPTVVKSFIFSNAAINELKVRAKSEQVPNPSRVQAVAGFIWERALHVSQSTTEEGEDTMLYMTVDMRAWMDPPLPREAIGNLSTMAFARSKKGATLTDLVAEVRAGISRIKNEIREYKGERAVEILRDNWNKRVETLNKYKGSVHKFVSWCNVGFNDVDFGFGKPRWVIPTDGIMSPIHKNLFVLNDYNDELDGSVGIEAWLFLELKDMEILENDREFLSFAKLYSH